MQLRFLRVEVPGDKHGDALTEPALQQTHRRAHAPRAVSLRGAIFRPVVARLEVRAAHDHGQRVFFPALLRSSSADGRDGSTGLKLDPGERYHARAPSMGLTVHARAERSAVHPPTGHRPRTRTRPRPTTPSTAPNGGAATRAPFASRALPGGRKREIVVRLQERRRRTVTAGVVPAFAGVGETRVPDRSRSRVVRVVGLAGADARSRSRRSRAPTISSAQSSSRFMARVSSCRHRKCGFSSGITRATKGTRTCQCPSASSPAPGYREPTRRVGVVEFKVPGHHPRRAQRRRRRPAAPRARPHARRKRRPGARLSRGAP